MASWARSATWGEPWAGVDVGQRPGQQPLAAEGEEYRLMVLWKESAEAKRLTISSSSIAVAGQGPSTSAAAVKKKGSLPAWAVAWAAEGL